jgi:hypothetical protein
MSDKEIKERLAAVFSSLNNIEVKGQSNVCNMAGCISILQEVLTHMAQESSREDKEDKE